MSDLRTYFDNNNKRLIDKYLHYFDIYERYFSRYRNTEVHFVEIGVFQGGSLQMWKEYFGPKAHIYGVDINPACKQFEEPQIQIFIGDQSDRRFLRQLGSEVPKIDILLDDGGHFMDQQIATFEELYPKIAPDGIYMCEDVHTSYWSDCAGGFRARGTFMEYSKYFVDYINAWHDPSMMSPVVEGFARSTYAAHFYDSIVVLEKKPVTKCERRVTGKPTFVVEKPQGFVPRLKARLPQLISMAKHKLAYRPYHKKA